MLTNITAAVSPYYNWNSFRNNHLAALDPDDSYKGKRPASPFPQPHGFYSKPSGSFLVAPPPPTLIQSQSRQPSLPHSPPLPPHVVARKQCMHHRWMLRVNRTQYHMTLHAQGVFSGSVPVAWLDEHGLFICQDCKSLVALSHSASHEGKCKVSSSNSVWVQPPSSLHGGGV